jgi:hypothetical protein
MKLILVLRTYMKEQSNDCSSKYRKPLKRKHKNPLKSYRKSESNRQRKGTKTIQDLKVELETIKKS